MSFHLVVNVVNFTVNGIYIADNLLLLLLLLLSSMSQKQSKKRKYSDNFVDFFVIRVTAEKTFLMSPSLMFFEVQDLCRNKKHNSSQFFLLSVGG